MIRLRGAVFGLALGAAPGAAFAAWAASRNPAFLDHLPSYLGLAVAPLAGLLGLLFAIWPRFAARGVWVGLVGLLAEAGLLAQSRARPQPVVHPVMVVVGIDGAPWSMVDQLHLPAIHALAARGARGVLRAEEPLFSPLLWTTLATGKSPELHGIHGFRVRSDQIKAAQVWDIAAWHGLSVGLYKWLVTWPPKAFPNGGFIVPGWLAPEPDTWPARLRVVKELELANRMRRKQVPNVRPTWRIALDGVAQGFRWSTLRDGLGLSLLQRYRPPPGPEIGARLHLLRVRMDRDVFLHELQTNTPDLATFTIYSTDALGHTHWGYMAEGGPLADAVPSAYQQADQVLAEIVAAVGPETVIVVLSDHGFRAAEGGDGVHHRSPRTERLQARIEKEFGPVEVARLGTKLTVSVLDVPDPELEIRRDALAAWLATLVQASTGQPLYRVEGVPSSPRALGLTLADADLSDQKLATDTVTGEPLADYVGEGEHFTGEHDRDGILVVAGPRVTAGTDLGVVPQIDVAPTLLGLLDLPAAEDMPGRVIFGEAGDRIATYDALSQAGKGEGVEAEVNEEALRALGYME